MNRVVAWVVGGVAAGAILLACGGSKSSAPTIQDSWMARLSADQMTGVEAARAERRAAEDDVNRANVALEDATNALQVAQAERDAANQMVDARKKAVEAARTTGDAAQIIAANRQLREVEATMAVNEAHVNHARAEVTAAKAGLAYAEARLATRETEVARARYVALSEADDTRVQGMNIGEFNAAIANAQQKEAEKQREMTLAQQQVAQAQKAWDDARSRREAATPSPQG